MHLELMTHIDHKCNKQCPKGQFCATLTMLKMTGQLQGHMTRIHHSNWGMIPSGFTVVTIDVTVIYLIISSCVKMNVMQGVHSKTAVHSRQDVNIVCIAG